MALRIHIDGGARGNPGPAGAGVTIFDENDQPVHEAGYYLGTQTNNSAEYTALILALQRVTSLPSQPIQIFSDSELMVKQITGQYQVKSPSLEKLFEQAQLLLIKVKSWSIRHVRREQNKRADELANLAMDQMRNVVIFDIEGEGKAAARPPTAAVTNDASQKNGAAPLSAAPGVTPVARRVSVCCTTAPAAGRCPAPPSANAKWEIGPSLPGGICLYAAQSFLTTLLALQGADAQEFPQIPTLTVRCLRGDCGATFAIGPTPTSNGHHA